MHKSEFSYNNEKLQSNLSVFTNQKLFSHVLIFAKEFIFLITNSTVYACLKVSP